MLIPRQQQRARAQRREAGGEAQWRAPASLETGTVPRAAAAASSPSGRSVREIISPIVLLLVVAAPSDAFIWPFDGDPFNFCRAARLSRRGWEVEAVQGGGRAGGCWRRGGSGRGHAKPGMHIPGVTQAPRSLHAMYGQEMQLSAKCNGGKRWKRGAQGSRGRCSGRHVGMLPTWRQ